MKLVIKTGDMYYVRQDIDNWRLCDEYGEIKGKSVFSDSIMVGCVANGSSEFMPKKFTFKNPEHKVYTWDEVCNCENGKFVAILNESYETSMYGRTKPSVIVLNNKTYILSNKELIPTDSSWQSRKFYKWQHKVTIEI